MQPIPAQDLRSNVGTWAVLDGQVPAVARRMLDALPTEPYDALFTGQRLETVYFDDMALSLRRARKAGGRYLTLRVRDYGHGLYALSAKTESEKFRIELPPNVARKLDTDAALVNVNDLATELLPSHLLARLLEITTEPLAAAVSVCFHRYAVEDERHRLTLDLDIRASTGKCYPAAVLEQKSTDTSAGALLSLPLPRIKLSKFLWSMPT